MTTSLRVAQLVSFSGVFILSLGVLLADETLADSFTIRCDWLDRGNVDAGSVARGYSGKYPCIVNGGVMPNQAEYDLDFPVTADYTVYALYTADGSRPVDILLDGKQLVRGFTDVTGNWNTDHAKWFKQCTANITAGKHTLKLNCESCIPHICALRFESPVAFPKDWRLNRTIAKKTKTDAIRPDREGFVGFYPLEPPDSYDYAQPYDHIPLPTPRAHRILEYTLIGAKYKVDAEVVRVGAESGETDAGDPARNELLQVDKIELDGTTDWMANLSVKINDERTERETLALSPARLNKMLTHVAELIVDFQTTTGVAPDYLAKEQDEAARTASAVETLLAEADTKAKWERFYQLYVNAYRLKNRVALSNPLITRSADSQLGFDKLVLAKRLTYNTSHIYTIYYDGSGRYKEGSGVFTLSPIRPDGQLTSLTPELKTDGIYRDPDLSWDADRVLFSYKPAAPDPFLIYECDIDGKNLRQLSDSMYDDVDPCYMPDGRIAFISTRCERVVLCHNAFTVSVLYTMDADGGNVRCISTNTINDFTPSVLADGQLAVSQWRYIDKHVGNNQSLWRCNPDGTRMVHVSGAHFGPVALWGARQVPNSRQIACIFGPHMPYAVGPVGLVDPVFTHSSPAIYTNLTPEIPPPSHASWQRRESGYYADVFPLSEDYFLVSYCYGPGERDATGYGLYLLDRWNNRDLIYRDPELSTFEAFPVKRRSRPTVVAPRGEGVAAAPNHADPEQSQWGTFYLLDVYNGLTGIERGEVKYLRVIEELAKPVSSRTRGHGLQNPAISFNGQFALKRLWGTVPVEADGSAYFKAPANRLVYFSALDENFMEIQRMRTFTTVAPGGMYGCAGCHEQKSSAVIPRDALALHREPSEITPPPHGGVHAPDFYHDVQPVLTKHCVKCHAGPKLEGGLDLSPEFTNVFNVAYENLCSKELVNYANIYQVSTLVTRPPKYYGSHASRVIEALKSPAMDCVDLAPEELRRLVTWIDCNAPYYGTYTYARPDTTGGRGIFDAHRGSMDDIYKRRCESCHADASDTVMCRIALPDIDKSRSLLAPLAKAAGGDESCKAKDNEDKSSAVFADKSDPDYQALTSVLGKIRSEAETAPRADMRDDRPPLTDPECRYVYRPGVIRDAPR